MLEKDSSIHYSRKCVLTQIPGAILILLIVVGIVFSRLKRPEGLVHLADAAFRRRRVLNWMLLGFGYAFLYWGRYNLQPAIEAMLQR